MTKKIFKLIAISIGLILTMEAVAQNMSTELRSETWDMSRHGEVMLKMPELSKITKAWMLNPQQVIELRYPGGEEGELWVEELKDWLVSLGVPSSAVRISPGSMAEDIINLELIKAE